MKIIFGAIALLVVTIFLLFWPVSNANLCRGAKYQSVNQFPQYRIANLPCCDQGAQVFNNWGLPVCKISGKLQPQDYIDPCLQKTGLISQKPVEQLVCPQFK